MSEPQSGSSREVRVRRGPKVPVFIVLGAILGVVAAAVLLQVTPPDADYSPGQAFGFLALVLATVGAAVGGTIAVVLDRISIRRARVVRAERLRETAAPRTDDPDASVPSPDQDDDAAATPDEVLRHEPPADDGFGDDAIPRTGAD